MTKVVKWKGVRDRMTEEQRRQSAVLGKAKIAQYNALQDIRKALALTQEQVARRLGMDQSEVSRLERRADIFVSTLRDYVNALDGELQIFAKLPTGTVRINAFDDSSEDALETVP